MTKSLIMVAAVQRANSIVSNMLIYVCIYMYSVPVLVGSFSIVHWHSVDFTSKIPQSVLRSLLIYYYTLIYSALKELYALFPLLNNSFFRESSSWLAFFAKILARIFSPNQIVFF